MLVAAHGRDTVTDHMVYAKPKEGERRRQQTTRPTLNQKQGGGTT